MVCQIIFTQKNEGRNLDQIVRQLSGYENRVYII